MFVAAAAAEVRTSDVVAAAEVRTFVVAAEVRMFAAAAVARMADSSTVEEKTAEPLVSRTELLLVASTELLR